MSEPTCPERVVLGNYLLGKLSEEEEAGITAHLSTCPLCMAALAELDGTSDGLVEDLRRPAPEANYLGEPALHEMLLALTSSGTSTVAHAPGVPRRLPVLPRMIGRFEIVREIGRGGMGVVYEARDTHLARVVALKVPILDALHPDAKERFLRENRAAAQVKDPHVCEILEVGEVAGTPFAVLPYCAAGSLADLLGQRQLSPQEAVELARKIALGLAAIHRAGIKHRDLKPSNVLLDPQGEPMITDFGLARQDTDAKSLTPDGAVVGTPHYMAPEQGEAQRELGATADIYSLGVVLYEMLTGVRPFSGSLLEILKQASEAPRPKPSERRAEIDSSLDALVQKAMAKRPAERHQSAQDLIAALERWLGAVAAATENLPPALPVRREVAPPLPAQPRAWWLRVALAAVLIVSVVSIVWAMLPPPDKGNPAEGRDPQIRKALGPAALVMRPKQLPGVKRWSIELAKQVEGEPVNHRSLAWSSDGKHLAVGAWSATACCTVRDTDTGAVVTRLDKVRLPVGGNPWGTDQKRTILALARTGSPELPLFDLEEKSIGILKGHKGIVQTFAASPGSVFFTSADDAKTIRVSRFDFGGTDVWIDSFKANVVAFAWGPPGLAIQCQDDTIRIRNTGNGKYQPPFQAGRLLGWSLDGHHLTTEGERFVLRLVDPKDGKETHQLKGHEGTIASVSWATEKGRLASVDERGQLIRWHIQNEKILAQSPLPHAAAPWVFSPDGQTLACCANNAVYFASGRDGKPIGVSLLIGDEKKYVTITADGHYAGSPGIDDDLVYVVETDQGQETLKPADFAKKYQWTNDPKRVKLLEFPEK